MSDDKTPAQATPHGSLIEQIKSSIIAKNEREWAAAREIERLERENAELRKQLEWREIETAPKDGAAILLYSPDDGCCQGYWFDGCDDTGWCTDGLFSNDWTHWMPLPEPPK